MASILLFFSPYGKTPGKTKPQDPYEQISDSVIYNIA